MRQFLSENTLIPAGMAVVVIGGGAVWLTTLFSNVQANTAAIESINKTQQEYNKNLMEINTRLIRIEDKISERKR